MKKYYLISMVLCGALFMGCDKDKDKDNDRDNEIPLMEDAIFQNDNPDLTIVTRDNILKSNSMGVKSSTDDGSAFGLKANDYGFKLVADVSTLRVQDADGITRTVQATHVKISDDGYAFVSYNHRGAPNVGGLVAFR